MTDDVIRFRDPDHRFPTVWLTAPPWGDDFRVRWGFRRWDEPLERRQFPVRDIRYLLARVKWWRMRKRRSKRWRRCPLAPLNGFDRAGIRTLLRRHGLPAQQLMCVVLDDIRKDRDAQQAHEAAQLNAEKQRQIVIASRERRMRAFREKQRLAQEWISFERIADWCAREAGGIIPDETRRMHAYAELQKSVMAGDFEKDGRSRVLLLNPATWLLKLTRERLAAIEETYSVQDVRTEFVAHCWVPRDLCKLWFETKRIALPWWLSAPATPTSGIKEPAPAEVVAVPEPAQKAPPAPAPINPTPRAGTRKPFNAKRAHAILVAARYGIFQGKVPTEKETEEHLRLHFTGIPSDRHREVRKKVWKTIRRGRPSRARNGELPPRK